MPKNIPIKAAKDISVAYEYPEVVIFAYDPVSGRQHVTTYGQTVAQCEDAAKAGNFLKKALGWPAEQCEAKPVRAKKKCYHKIMSEVAILDIRGPFRHGDNEAYASIVNMIVFLSNKVRAITLEGPGNEIEVDLPVLRALRFLKNGIYFDANKVDDEFVGRILNSIKVKVDYDRTSFGSVFIGRDNKVYFELKLIGLELYPKLFEK